MQKIAGPAAIRANICALFLLLAAVLTPAAAASEPEAGKTTYEGSMTLERMAAIIRRIDKNAKSPRKGTWQLTVQKHPVVIVTDDKNDRMRILVPVAYEKDVSDKQLKRIAQANFDTALDSRYALAKGILWSAYLHPLRALHDRQFVTAIGQTVNLAATYGTLYTSGAMSYQGGDSGAIIQRQLIDELVKKGLDI